MSSEPKSKMAAGGHRRFWFLSILLIPPCSLRGSLAMCKIWSVYLKPFKSYGFWTEIQAGGRRPSWILIFVIFGSSAMFRLWISSHVPNLKRLARAVRKLWALNRNPRWRPAAILFLCIGLLIVDIYTQNVDTHKMRMSAICIHQSALILLQSVIG